MAKDPDKILVVIDPRLSETAQIANIHLALRPGTDALLTRAMIAIILEERWENKEYIAAHVTGFESIRPWFEGFDSLGAVRVCELDYDQVREVCRLFATRKSCLHGDLGMFMNRHSTVTSYLELILLAICGRICVTGGNILPGRMGPLGSHTDERDERTWRTLATDIPAVGGFFPPNVMPEEIMANAPERLRAVITSASNPLRSYADTRAYEEAFKQLDLLVSVDIAMTETTALAHYVLPARSAYESWDSSFFAWTYPEVFFQMRRPVVVPEGEQIEAGEIFVRLADAMGLIPDVPSTLLEAARSGYGPKFRKTLGEYLAAEPGAKKVIPFVVAKTLGETLGSVHLSTLYAILQSMPRVFHENAARAGFKPGPALGDELFAAIEDHPEGLWVGKCDPENNFDYLATEDGRINVYILELEDWVKSIDAATEEELLKPDPEFPLILMAGRHHSMTANTLMRDPSWNKGRRACTLAMHPTDAHKRNLTDGQMVRITTEAGEGTVELEVTETSRPGHVVIPHGFGLNYQGEVYGINVNQLTKNTHRDRMFGTPLHRYVPCRVEKNRVTQTSGQA
jgi:anaerobic selenocysteine-containing dehydrogenase